MRYLFAEFKANSNLQISKRFLFAEKRATAVTLHRLRVQMFNDLALAVHTRFQHRYCSSLA
jgi:hypothetical protein